MMFELCFIQRLLVGWQALFLIPVLPAGKAN